MAADTSDNSKMDNKTKSGGLVKVSGKGTLGSKFDNFGHEIEANPQPSEPANLQPSEPAKPTTLRAGEPANLRTCEPAKPRDREPRVFIDESPDENDNPEKNSRTQTIAKDKETMAQLRVRNRKEKRKNRTLALIRLLIFLACIAGLIILVKFSGRKKPEINTKYVLKGSVENSLDGTMNIFMSEEQVVSSYSGIFVPSVNEGDRVSAGSVIGYVVESRYTSKLEQLKSVEEKITAALKAAEYLGDSKPSETAVIDNHIAAEIKNLSAMAMSGKISGYSSSADGLARYFTERNDIVMNENSQDAYIASLQSQRSQILKEIESSMHKISAPQSGIISFNTDGAEMDATRMTEALKQLVNDSDFNSHTFINITAEDYENIKPLNTVMSARGNTAVNNGTVVARVSTELSYYITLETSAPADESVRIGQSINIRTRSGDINFKATYLGTFKCDSKYILVAKSDKAVANAISLRSSPGRFIFTYVEGLKVPLTALTEWDEAGITARLTVIRAGYVEYVYVNILADDGEYAIINAKASMDEDGIYVKASDEYVVDFDKVTEGQQM